MKDDKLAQLAKDCLESATLAKKYSEEASNLKARIKAEMEKRKVKSLRYDDVQITYSAPSRAVYDEGILSAVSPKIRKQIVSSVLDTKKLSLAVQDGLIEPKLLKAYTRMQDSTPYVTVTSKE